MKNILLIIVSVSLLFSSCKKEELNGDLAYLEGKWKLSVVINSAGSWTGPPQEQDVCYLEFKHSGKIIFADADGKVLERGRITSVVSSPSGIYSNGVNFEVKVGSNAIFNKQLNKLDIIIFIPSPDPDEIMTNDIVYGTTDAISLVFRKMGA